MSLLDFPKQLSGALLDSEQPEAKAAASESEQDDSESSSASTKAHEEIIDNLAELNADINNAVTGVVTKPLKAGVGLAKEGLDFASMGLFSALTDTLTGDAEQHATAKHESGGKEGASGAGKGILKEVVETVAENPELLAAL